MARAMVRISSEAYTKLKQLAELTGEPTPVILDKAVETYRRQQFLNALAADFARLREDPNRWGEELHERRAWESSGPNEQEADTELLRRLDEDRLSNRKLFPPEMKDVTW